MNNKTSLSCSSFSVYLSSLAALPDRALIERVGRLAARERRATAGLVAHLAEMEARRLHLREGYSSLFAYCTEALHLSAQAAYNRIEAARAARRFPIVLARLADGSVHLTAIRLLAPILTEENHEALLEEARHKSRRDVEEIVARVRPAPPVPTSVRRLTEPAALQSDAAPPGPPTEVLPLASGPAPQISPASVQAPPSLLVPSAASPAVPCSTVVSAASPAVPGPGAAIPRPAVAPLAPGRYRVQFTASGEMHARLRHAQALLRHQVPNGDIAVVFDLALQALIDRVETRKFARRKRPKPGIAEPKRPREAEGKPPQAGITEPNLQGSGRDDSQAPHRPTVWLQARPHSRYIPAGVRRAVWERDRARCSYVSAGGRRCTETSFLEFDHREPHACGGPATVENLRLRCRAHNTYEAEERFGPERIRARAPRSGAMGSSSRNARRTARSSARRTCENEHNSSRDELCRDSQSGGSLRERGRFLHDEDRLDNREAGRHRGLKSPGPG